MLMKPLVVLNDLTAYARAARKGQATPDGCHNMERKLKRLAAQAALQFRRRDSSRHFRRGPDLR